MATKTRKGKPKGFGACPTWFYARCREASDSPDGFIWAGLDLAQAVQGLEPCDVPEAEWRRRVGELADMIDARDDSGIMEWLETNVPRCLALVPETERGRFLAGIYRAVGEAGLDLRQW